MDVHTGHVGLAVTLNHAQEFPAVALIETGVVCDEVGRRNALGAQIFHRHVQQLACDAAAAVALFGVHGADVGGQIGSVMEVVLDDTQTADEAISVHAQEPTQLGFLLQIGFHAFKIGFCGDTPLAVEPLCGGVHQFGLLP